MDTLYTFLIVDDEPIIREGMRDHIPWEELGFRFVAACGNGNEALEVLERTPVDVVLTDICMPFMDGLALARHIRNQYPATKVILLTGYDEFDYAHQALKLGVDDYILKPITPAFVREMLLSLRKKLDEERKRFQDDQFLRKQLEESLPLLRERVLNRLLTPEVSISDMESHFKFLNLSIPVQGVQYIISVVELLSALGTEHEVMNRLSEIGATHKILQTTHVPWIDFRNAHNQSVFLLWSATAQGVYREALLMAELLENHLPLYVKGTVHIGVGNPVSSLDRIHQSYQEAVEALQLSILRGQRKVLSYREITGGSRGKVGELTYWGKEIRKALILGDQEYARKIVGAMKNHVRSVIHRLEEYHLILTLTVAYLLQSAQELEIPVSEFFSSHTNPFIEVQACKTLEEMEDWLLRFIEKMNQYLRIQQEDFSLQKVREAELFIKESYSNPNLTIGLLCKELSISTSYFSAIFKKHRGKTFLEYLTEIRIEKAKELLKTTNLKTYEIAERVGYPDSHYFSLLFRKTVGIPPTAFRTEGSHVDSL